MDGAYRRMCVELFADNSGATVVEYALIIGAIAIGLIAMLMAIGIDLTKPFGAVSNGISQVASP